MGLALLLIQFRMAVRDLFTQDMNIQSVLLNSWSTSTNIRWNFLALRCLAIFFPVLLFLFVYMIKLLAIA